MQSHVSASFSSYDCNGGVCVADGYGVQVRVRNKQLVVSDGIGRYRRERNFPRALAGIKRLVVIGHEGAVTLEAFRWLSDLGIAFIHVDRDGRILTATATPGLDDPRLRRRQALAAGQPAGLAVSRYLLTAKLAGQGQVLARLGFPEASQREVGAASERAREAATLEEVLWAEASGAAAYWNAWSDVEIRFAKQDQKRVPEHWRTFGQRSSPITGSPRLAANPANAMLNYLYALLEAEARLACLACGLDPGFGFFHTDQRGRDSLTLDIMEAVRPDVDRYLLELLDERTFRLADFTETRKGVCRVLAPVSHRLAESTTTWASLLGPVVEGVVRLLGKATGASERIPTPLTNANRSAAQTGKKRTVSPGQMTLRTAARAKTCRSCGSLLEESKRRYCYACWPEKQEETEKIFKVAGPAALAKLRAEGRDPAHTEKAKGKVGKSVSEERRANLEWERENELPDPKVFEDEILPGLQRVTLPVMQKATGLSRKYCADIRKGRVPHPRHWTSLRNLFPGQGLRISQEEGH
jgi:CRISPR-associated endonuclease Cas1